MLPLLNPRPDGFNDLTIDGEHEGYEANPEECIATWGSAALFGYPDPAYTSIFLRTVEAAKFPSLTSALLDAPPDPCADLRVELAALQTAHELLKGQLEVEVLAHASTASRLANAKGLATQIVEG
jgi:hypothetical protein